MNEKTKKNGGESPEAERMEGPVEIVGISFKDAGKIYYFAPADTSFSVGDEVIVETSRGLEVGRVKIANRTVDGSTVVPPLKPVVRKVSAEDRERIERNRESEIHAAFVCKRKIREHKLDMSLVCAEYTFDRAKLTFYFTCETRVDFRELVKDLASTFRTRIELRQIGIRDETKMMGGLGICGRKYCCAGFLTDFVQVSIKMAKEQNFSLNSAKISGACGRLMCCLRYEHETYEQALKVTPAVGTTVETPDGVGVVIETRPLAMAVKVKLHDKDKDGVKLYSCADLGLVPREAKEVDEPTEAPDEPSAEAPKDEQKPRREGEGRRGGRRHDRRRGKGHHRDKAKEPSAQ